MPSTFLEVDPTAQKGYIEVNGRPGPGYRPAYITRSSGRVIYSNNGGPAPRGCNPYTDNIYQKRRTLCDSALGILMLDNPVFTQKAFQKVNLGIKKYFIAPEKKEIKNAKEMVLKDGKYIANPTSFGRFSPNHTTRDRTGNNQFYEEYIRRWIAELECQDVAKVMCLYDIFVKLYCRKEHADRRRRNPQFPLAAFSHLENPKKLSLHFGYRELWYDNKKTRGRDSKPFGGLSSMPALIPERVGLMPGRLQSLERAGVLNGGTGRNRDDIRRKRGIDMFQKNEESLRTSYQTVLANLNLNFSASASGTTSTLLASARCFAEAMFLGRSQDVEGLKQYVMACVAYLVGSGMHTCHEVFFTANKVGGLTYSAGKYDSLLPLSFTTSALYTSWKDEFWDVHSR